MTPRARRTLATLRRQIGPQTLMVRRGSGAGAINNAVRARVTGYQPEELVGDINQGDRKVVILAEDVTLEGGIQPGDRLIWHSAPLTIETIDNSTGDIDGTRIAIYVRARGH